MNICNRTGILECMSCGGILDLKGDHECPKDGAWVKPHNAIRDVFYETARQGLVECKRELRVTFKPECAECKHPLTTQELGPGNPCPHPNAKEEVKKTLPKKDQHRVITPSYTADIAFEQGIPGLTLKPTLVDFTIKHEFLSTYRSREAQQLGLAAKTGEDEKNNDFKARTERLDRSFVAAAFNSLGHARPNGEILAYYLIAQRALHKGMTFQESASLFWHTLSMVIHRAHARNIIRRLRDITYDMTVPRV